jgi:hypothetical protein
VEGVVDALLVVIAEHVIGADDNARRTPGAKTGSYDLPVEM